MSAPCTTVPVRIVFDKLASRRIVFDKLASVKTRLEKSLPERFFSDISLSINSVFPLCIPRELVIVNSSTICP